MYLRLRRSQLRLDNEVSQEFFMKPIGNEREIFESALHAVAIISKAAAQRAAIAAIDVLRKRLKKLSNFDE